MGVMPSVGSVCDDYDNVMAESFFAPLEKELLHRRRFKSQTEARTAIFEWIEGWYNLHRRYSSLGRIAPLTSKADNWSTKRHSPKAKIRPLKRVRSKSLEMRYPKLEAR